MLPHEKKNTLLSPTCISIRVHVSVGVKKAVLYEGSLTKSGNFKHKHPLPQGASVHVVALLCDGWFPGLGRYCVRAELRPKQGLIWAHPNCGSNVPTVPNEASWGTENIHWANKVLTLSAGWKPDRGSVLMDSILILLRITVKERASWCLWDTKTSKRGKVSWPVRRQIDNWWETERFKDPKVSAHSLKQWPQLTRLNI